MTSLSKTMYKPCFCNYSLILTMFILFIALAQKNTVIINDRVNFSIVFMAL